MQNDEILFSSFCTKKMARVRAAPVGAARFSQNAPYRVFRSIQRHTVDSPRFPKSPYLLCSPIPSYPIPHIISHNLTPHPLPSYPSPHSPPFILPPLPQKNFYVIIKGYPQRAPHRHPIPQPYPDSDLSSEHQLYPLSLNAEFQFASSASH